MLGIWIVLGLLLLVFPFAMILVGILLNESPFSLVDRWLNKLDLWLDRWIFHPSRYKDQL
jgi:hypothetical protein